MQNLNKDTKLSLYRQMLRIRMVEETIAKLYAEQEMRCPVHLSIGQEAVAIGICSQLGKQDVVFSGHRCHAHYIAKGGGLRELFAELYGKSTGCCGGKGGSMHLTDQEKGFMAAAPIVSSTIPMAVGAALSFQMRKQSALAVAFLGDAAVEEGVFFESLNFAALKKLPVLFVVENNFYSVYSPLSVRQPAGRNFSDLARTMGVQSWSDADGNKIEEVHSLADEAIANIRSGSGPALLAFTTYRWREHCGPNYDNDLGYRDLAEYEEWRARCPVDNFRMQLISEGVMNLELAKKLSDEIQAEIDDAVKFAKESPFPNKNELLSHVFAL